ncbi:MAG TPA: hypothetical protein QF698_01965, partial [Candidatus Marinimicrobia bacterium]|nr:hypothetical protein [Candidatus Neomarinimicrobiota bacterium]
MKASFRTILFLLTFFSLAGTAKAQLKMGYILSERIHAEYDEFKEGDLQMQAEYKKIQVEFEQMALKIDSLKQEYEVKRLMSLDKGASIKQEIEQM